MSHIFVLSSKGLPTWKVHLAMLLQGTSPEKTTAPNLEGAQGQRLLPDLRPLQTTQQLLSTAQKYNAPNTAHHKPAMRTRDATKLQHPPHPPPREASSNTLPSPAEPHAQASRQGLRAKAAAPRATQGRHKAGNTPHKPGAGCPSPYQRENAPPSSSFIPQPLANRLQMWALVMAKHRQVGCWGGPTSLPCP